MNWLPEAARVWGVVGAVLSLGMSLFAATHAVLYKREARAATLWVGFIWLVPLVGALLYFLLGINRIKRRANVLRGTLESYRTPQVGAECSGTDVADRLPPEQSHLRALAVATAKVASRPLVTGNRIELLVNGDAAYPAMLEAIAGARHSLTLSTYIFDRDAAGLAFAHALGAAVRRGVEVRVLIDATGTRYSWPPILGELRRARVRYARFLPAFPLWRLVSMNLRNHRKILVADGRLGFTGGMNLRVGHWLSRQPAHPVQDLHFRLAGPVVAQLQEVFAEDWSFTTGESLRGDLWFPPLRAEGPVIARGIADGPDEDFEKLRWTLLAALAAARESVRIATPYFLPEPGLITALNLAALRGVQVDILLPARSNLPLVDWASTAQWWQVLERGCRLWLSPPPFDHSKLMVVDGAWSLVGSANWDPRSLRLNFEFNVEAYDPAFAGVLTDWFETHRRHSRPVSLADVDGRTFPARVRDGMARLLTPYL